MPLAHCIRTPHPHNNSKSADNDGNTASRCPDEGVVYAPMAPCSRLDSHPIQTRSSRRTTARLCPRAAPLKNLSLKPPPSPQMAEKT